MKSLRFFIMTNHRTEGAYDYSIYLTEAYPRNPGPTEFCAPQKLGPEFFG
jgi:hypothetical protein